MNLDAPVTATSQPTRNIDPRLMVLCGSSLVGAAFGNGLLFDELPGINWTLWMLLSVAGFVCWARTSGRPLGAQRSLFSAVSCCLAVGAAITDVPWLHLAILASFLMLSSWTILASPAQSAQQHLGKVLFAPVLAMVRILQADQQVATEAGKALGVRRNLAAVRGVVIALPIVFVFFLLLSAADPTLDGWRSGFIEAISDWAFVPQVVFFVVLAVAILGAYRIALWHRSEAAPPTVAAIADRGVLEGTERLIVLAAVAALFALFLVLQASYLFTNSGARPGSGMTFAEAAHRGFAELTVTVILTGALIIALERFAKPGALEQRVKYCALLLIAEAIPMLLSANSRIAHYEAAYGYTLARLYVHVYIGLVCIAVVLLARQVSSSVELGRLVQQFGVACMLALATLCFWNHAGWVVAKNVERYAVTSTIDIEHLKWLADTVPDSIPQLAAAVNQLGEVEALQLRSLLYQRASQPARRKLDADGQAREARWYRWNLRRAQAQDVLDELAAAGLR